MKVNVLIDIQNLKDSSVGDVVVKDSYGFKLISQNVFFNEVNKQLQDYQLAFEEMTSKYQKLSNNYENLLKEVKNLKDQLNAYTSEAIKGVENL